LFKDRQPIATQNVFDLRLLNCHLTFAGPSAWEKKALLFSVSTYHLPWSWDTVTSTCSLEELPPLSVQVMVVV
jgi:hypothetical protein